MLRHLTLFAMLFLLCACTATSPVPAGQDQAATITPGVTEPTPEPVPERAFPDDSLYELLVAEFALRRKAYDVALANYMTLAPVLRDKGVSSHTTHLTQFLQREEEMLSAARLWVELDPENIEANAIMGNLLVRQGQPVAALPHLALTTRHGKDTNFPVLLNGFRELDQQQQAALQTQINKLAAEFPRNTKLLLTRALIHSELQQYEQALDALEQLFKLEENDPQALILEAKIRLSQNSKKPFAHLEKVLKKEPENKLLRLQYARLLTGTDMPAARAQFEFLTTQSPRDGDLLFSLALINKELDDYLAANAYLNQLLGLQQRVDEAHYYLGRIAEERGEPLAAVPHYMKVEDSRQYLAANSRIAEILAEHGQSDRSSAWFDQQRLENPQRGEQLYGLQADVLLESGAPEQAIKILNQALDETPTATVLRYARAMLSEQQDDLVSMEQDLRFILEEDPDNTTALNALGYTLANRTNRYEEALELVSRALQLQPDEPAILDSMGWVLFRTGRHEEAIHYLTKAYADFPDPEVAAHLGEALWTTGKIEAAKAVWQGAALRNPDHQVLRNTLDRLGVGTLEQAAPASPALEQQP